MEKTALSRSLCLENFQSFGRGSRRLVSPTLLECLFRGRLISGVCICGRSPAYVHTRVGKKHALESVQSCQRSEDRRPFHQGTRLAGRKCCDVCSFVTKSKSPEDGGFLLLLRESIWHDCTQKVASNGGRSALDPSSDHKQWVYFLLTAISHEKEGSGLVITSFRETRKVVSQRSKRR